MNGDIFSLSLPFLFCDSSTLVMAFASVIFHIFAADDNIHDSELFIWVHHQIV